MKRERRAAVKAEAVKAAGVADQPGPATSVAAGAQAAEDEEEELDEFEAYNQMLQRYNEGKGGSVSDYYNQGFPDQR